MTAGRHPAYLNSFQCNIYSKLEIFANEATIEHAERFKLTVADLVLLEHANAGKEFEFFDFREDDGKSSKTSKIYVCR